MSAALCLKDRKFNFKNLKLKKNYFSFIQNNKIRIVSTAPYINFTFFNVPPSLTSFSWFLLFKFIWWVGVTSPPLTHTHTHLHTHTHTLTFTQYLNLWAKIARDIFLYKRSHDALASKTFLFQNLCLARNICTDVSVSL